MRIVQYNTFSKGGSAVMMRRLHRVLKENGIDAQMRCKAGDPGEPDLVWKNYCTSRIGQIGERFFRRFENWIRREDSPSYFGRLISFCKTPPLKEDAKADVVHLHWISQWLDLPSFLNGIPKSTPIVWTIHDMSPLAGGCFTDFECEQYEKNCLSCPLLKYPFNYFVSSRELKRRVKALDGRQLYAVGNSDFTTSLIKRSKLFSTARKISTILPGIDMNILSPMPKDEARHHFGIPNSAFVLGFGAASLTDQNKGIDRFFKVAELVSNQLGPVHVLLFGEGKIEMVSEKIVIHLVGRLDAASELCQAYSAMDVFLLTSRMETFGQVAIEAQACGTPAWAFDVGGVSDAVKKNVGGGLVPFNDCQGMADEIIAEFKSNRLYKLGQTGSSWVREKFTISKMTDSYVDLYKEAKAQKI